MTTVAFLVVAAWAGLHWFSSSRVHVNFVTYPFGAAVLLDGRLLLDDSGQPATTPCTIDNISARQHDVEFQHPDFPDLKLGTIDFGTHRQIVRSWGSSADESEAPPVLDRSQPDEDGLP